MKFLLLCVLLTLAFSVSAAKFKVVTEDYPPYNYKEGSKITGMSTEIVQEVFQRAGIDYELKLHPWARSYESTLKNDNTIIYSITLTDERKPLFKWVGPLSDTSTSLVAKKSDSIVIDKIEDLANYKIGVVKNDVGEQLLLKKGVAKTNMERVAKPILNLKKLFAGRIDLICYETNVILGALAEKAGKKGSDLEEVYVLNKGQLYIGFNKGIDDSVIKRCQKALDEIKADGTYTKIVNRYVK